MQRREMEIAGVCIRHQTLSKQSVRKKHAGMLQVHILSYINLLGGQLTHILHNEMAISGIPN
jgi:hypothetical protein